MIKNVPLMKNTLIYFLFLLFCTNVVGQSTTIFPKGSPWKYRYDQIDQGTAWRTTTFDDGSWTTGNGEFGFGDGDETTVLQNNGNNLTIYLRKVFQLTNSQSFSHYTLSLLRDDGAVAYLNGKEIVRSNMKNDDISFSSLAATEVLEGNETSFVDFNIPHDAFVDGVNVLAIEIHQASINNADASFNAYLVGNTVPSCQSPSAISVANIGTTTSNVSWSGISNALSYTVRYRPVNIGNWISQSTATNSTSLIALIPNTDYEVQVLSNCSSFNEYGPLSYFRTLTAFCETPINLSVNDITAGSAVASWSTIIGASSYNVQYRRIGTMPWNTKTSTSNSSTLTGLLENSNYECQVQAVCDINSAFTTSINFTTLASGTSFLFAANTSWKYLDNGTNQGTTWRATNFNDSSWASGNAELGYGEGDETTVVSFGPNANTKYVTTYFRKSFSVANPLAYSSLSFELIRDDGAVVYLNGVEIFRNNLPTGTISFNTYAITSVGGSDESAWYTAPINIASLLTGTNVIAVEIHQQSLLSSDLSFNGRLSTTVPISCGTPDNLNTSSIGTTSAILHWQAINGATSYNIQYRLIGSPTWIIATSTSNSKSISSLEIESNYEFQVQANCASLGAFSASSTFITNPISCDAPTAITVSPITSTTARINWQAVADAVNYTIQYRVVGSTTWVTTSTTAATKPLTGLLAATNYEFQIQAQCLIPSAFSSLSTFTTTGPTCTAPTDLNITSTTASIVQLSWTMVESATSYIIEYQLAGTGAWINTTSTTNTKTITGLIASTPYEFRVKAVCSFTGNYSSTVSFTTYTAGTDFLIAPSSAWKYLDNGTNQGTNWRSTSFDDAAWSTGNAEFGYGEGDETTVISYGPNASAKYTTTYFRRSFTITNPLAFPSLSLGIVRDDGIVVYLNGTEVYRNNLPTGTIAFNTLALTSIGGTDEIDWLFSSISPSLLVSGTNVLAIEIHQQSAASSDLSFNGQLTTPSTIITPAVTRGAYLQKLTPNSITVRWRTDIACSTQVQFGASVAYGNIVSNATLVTEHEITLTGLTPNTKYFYAIGTTSQILQGDLKNNFYTAPVVGSTTAVRIWGIGDFGNGTTNQLNVRNAYTTYTGTTPTNLWIWLGDDAYTTGQDAEFQSRVFAQYPDQFKSMPLFPTMGNHDYADVGYQSTSALTTNFPYFSIFSVPQNAESGGVASNSKKYYSYNYANIHFISLDSYGSLNAPGSAMYNWLQSDLAANTQRWTVVYMHHPPYTLGTHNSNTEEELIDMRTNIVPLLENYKVDLVLSGHSHVNERSYMMKGHLGTSSTFTPAMKVSTQTNNFVKTAPYNGTVYAVCGTSGQDPEAINQVGFPMPAMFFNNNTNNCSLVIDVNGDNLACKYLTSAGVIVDDFTITKN